MSAAARLLVVASAVVGLGCGDDGGIGPPSPSPAAPHSGPGAVGFEVTVPADMAHGGLLLAVSGGPVDSITGLSGYEVFHGATATGARAIVFGTIVSGPLVQVWVPDGGRADQYAIVVEEGALQGTYATVPPESYGVTRVP